MYCVEEESVTPKKIKTEGSSTPKSAKKKEAEETTNSPQTPRKELDERRKKALSMLLERLKEKQEEGKIYFPSMCSNCI